MSTDDLVKAAQAALHLKSTEGDVEIPSEQLDQYGNLVRHLQERINVKPDLDVALIGGEASKVLSLNWPPLWNVEHISSDSKQVASALASKKLDVVFVFERWSSRNTRKQIAAVDDGRKQGPNIVWWGSGGGELCKFCNYVAGSAHGYLKPEINWPKEILRAKTVREFIQYLRRRLGDDPTRLVGIVRGARLACPPLRGMTEEEATEAAYAALRAIATDEEEKQRQREEKKRADELRKPREKKETTVVKQPEPATAETPPPAPPKDDGIYATIQGLVSDAKRVDVWKREEMEILVCAWQEAPHDAEALIQNFRTLGGKRSVTSVLFQLQRIAAAAGKPLSQKIAKALKEMSVDDRKKSTLSIVEFIEKKAGSTAVDEPPAPPEPPTDRERMWNESFAPPGSLMPGSTEKFRALVEHIVNGVALGLDTKEAAFDRLALLVRK